MKLSKLTGFALICGSMNSSKGIFETEIGLKFKTGFLLSLIHKVLRLVRPEIGSITSPSDNIALCHADSLIYLSSPSKSSWSLTTSSLEKLGTVCCGGFFVLTNVSLVDQEVMRLMCFLCFDFLWFFTLTEFEWFFFDCFWSLKLFIVTKWPFNKGFSFYSFLLRSWILNNRHI